MQQVSLVINYNLSTNRGVCSCIYTASAAGVGSLRAWQGRGRECPERHRAGINYYYSI